MVVGWHHVSGYSLDLVSQSWHPQTSFWPQLKTRKWFLELGWTWLTSVRTELRTEDQDKKRQERCKEPSLPPSPHLPVATCVAQCPPGRVTWPGPGQPPGLGRKPGNLNLASHLVSRPTALTDYTTCLELLQHPWHHPPHCPGIQVRRWGNHPHYKQD